MPNRSSPSGPDAVFRAPADSADAARDQRVRRIPAAMSLSAGVYVCNAVMYSTLHALRSRPRVPAGFIHLPYTAAQAAHHRATASMSVDLMTAGVEIALGVLARTKCGKRVSLSSELTRLSARTEETKRCGQCATRCPQRFVSAHRNRRCR